MIEGRYRRGAARLGRALTAAAAVTAAPERRGWSFWLMTLLLGLLLPAPVAVAVVAARFRRPAPGVAAARAPAER